MLWNGFEQIEFTFEEHLAYVIIPNKKIENPSLLIKTEYFNAFPETEIALLEEGYYLGFIKNDNRWGTDEDTLIKVVANRTNHQRQQIKLDYKTKD